MDPQCLTIDHALHYSPVWMAFAVGVRDCWTRWGWWAKRVASTDNFTRTTRDQASMTSDMQPSRIFIRYVVQAFTLSDQKGFDLVIMIDVDPTECAVRRCITPDEIGCIMGHTGKSSEFSIEPFCSNILDTGRGVERGLFRKVVPINGYQVMVFPGRGKLPYCIGVHGYCIHTL